MNPLEDSLRSVLTDEARDAPDDAEVVRHVLNRTRRRDRDRRIGLSIGLAAAATAVVILVPEAVGGRGHDTTGETIDSRTSSAPEAPEAPPNAPTGPLFAHQSLSCVEQYSPRSVMDRAFSFDGTVSAIGQGRTDRGDEADLGYAGVTFDVHEWFRGGDSATITIDLDPPGSGDGTVGSETGPAYAVGTRLLVSGEHRWGGSTDADLLGWTCGFTRYHDASTAEAWRQASG